MQRRGRRDISIQTLIFQVCGEPKGIKKILDIGLNVGLLQFFNEGGKAHAGDQLI